MALWGFLDMKITGPESDMQRLTAHIVERDDGGWPNFIIDDPERDFTHGPMVEPDCPRREGDTLILNLWTKYAIDWRLFDLFAEQFPALMIEGNVYFEGDAYEGIPTRYVHVHCHGGEWSREVDDEGEP